MRKHLLIALATLVASAFLLPTAAMAQEGGSANGGFGLGLGWASLDAETGATTGGGSENDSFMALAQYRGEAWEVELDYLFGDENVWALHGDYIFNFSRDYTDFESGAYAGIGYTYVSFDSGGGTTGGTNDDTDSGINVMLGYDIDRNWGIEGRYAFMDNNFFTIAAFYSFGEDAN